MSSTASAATSTGSTSCSSWPSATGWRPTTSRSASAASGASDDDTRSALEAALGRVAERRDPDDPDVTYEALSVQYLAGDGEAVVDSCYLDAGGRDLDDLGVAPAEEASG